MRVIEELFLIQRETFDEDCFKNEKYILKDKENKQCYDYFYKVLTDDRQVELLEKCIVSDDELSDIVNFYYFEKGFKLAKLLLLEMLEKSE